MPRDSSPSSPRVNRAASMIVSGRQTDRPTVQHPGGRQQEEEEEEARYSLLSVMELPPSFTMITGRCVAPPISSTMPASGYLFTPPTFVYTSSHPHLSTAVSATQRKTDVVVTKEPRSTTNTVLRHIFIYDSRRIPTA